MRKIRKGDDVIVTTGRDKGKRGTVLRIVDAEHVVVEGANRVKKHQRPIPMKGVTGGIIDRDMPCTSRKWRITTRRPRKPTASASGCWRTDGASAISNPTVK